MKRLLSLFLLLGISQLPEAGDTNFRTDHPADTTGNVFIITVDGLRWQELFNGAEGSLINDEKFTADTAMANMMYWSDDANDRRQKLMPFMWSVAAKKGQLYGNRDFENNVNVANIYAVSYPGYNEMFTGTTDITIANNSKVNNPNTNVFEYLESKEAYKGKIGIFTSWDVLSFALNEKRSGIEMNCGYENIDQADSSCMAAFNKVQDDMDYKPGTRQDMLTYIAAKEYLQKKKPKILYLGLGETDEYAHAKDYATYLQKANETDHIIAELWHWAQSTPGYKNNTTFVITTDHGRGQHNKWTSHGPFIKGSSQAWLVLLGKYIEPRGEVKNPGQLYQKQIAQTIAGLMGEQFGKQRSILPTLALR